MLDQKSRFYLLKVCIFKWIFHCINVYGKNIIINFSQNLIKTINVVKFLLYQFVFVFQETKHRNHQTKVKNASYNKRLVSSTPTPCVQQSTTQNKKKKKTKPKTPPRDQVLCRDDMMSSNTVDELIDERNRLKEYLEHVSNKKALVEVNGLLF